MSISAADVKKLRDMTGAGMMDAKQALTENNGDFDNAVKYLREKGLADSKKRADKDANQGTIGDYIHYQQDRAVAGVLVEIACETDFVAKSEEFKNVAKQVAMHIAALKPEYLNVEDVPETRIEEEKEIIKNQSLNEGKPEEVVAKIVEGKINSFYKDYVLNEQTFCNPDFYEGKVSTMIEELSGKLGEKIYIKQFSRIEVGA
jgi:elongation factor Ts